MLKSKRAHFDLKLIKADSAKTHTQHSKQSTDTFSNVLQVDYLVYNRNIVEFNWLNFIRWNQFENGDFWSLCMNLIRCLRWFVGIYFDLKSKFATQEILSRASIVISLMDSVTIAIAAITIVQTFDCYGFCFYKLRHQITEVADLRLTKLLF